MFSLDVKKLRKILRDGISSWSKVFHNLSANFPRCRSQDLALIVRKSSAHSAYVFGLTLDPKEIKKNDLQIFGSRKISFAFLSTRRAPCKRKVLGRHLFCYLFLFFRLKFSLILGFLLDL